MELGVGKIVDGQRVGDTEIGERSEARMVIEHLRAADHNERQKRTQQVFDIGRFGALRPSELQNARDDECHRDHTPDSGRRTTGDSDRKEERRQCRHSRSDRLFVRTDNVGRYEEIRAQHREAEARALGDLVEIRHDRAVPHPAGGIDHHERRGIHRQRDIGEQLFHQLVEGHAEEDQRDRVEQQYADQALEIMPRDQVERHIQEDDRTDAVVGIVFAVIQHMVPLGADILFGARRPVVGVLHAEQLFIRLVLKFDLTLFECVDQLLRDLVAGIHAEIRFRMQVDRRKNVGEDHDADDQYSGD